VTETFTVGKLELQRSFDSEFEFLSKIIPLCGALGALTHYGLRTVVSGLAPGAP
jgi:hypothetical protein